MGARRQHYGGLFNDFVQIKVQLIQAQVPGFHLGEVEDVGIEALYFAYFFRWSMADNYDYIKDKIDFKTEPGGRTDGTFIQPSSVLPPPMSKTSACATFRSSSGTQP